MDGGSEREEEDNCLVWRLDWGNTISTAHTPVAPSLCFLTLTTVEHLFFQSSPLIHSRYISLYRQCIFLTAQHESCWETVITYWKYATIKQRWLCWAVFLKRQEALFLHTYQFILSGYRMQVFFLLQSGRSVSWEDGDFTMHLVPALSHRFLRPSWTSVQMHPLWATIAVSLERLTSKFSFVQLM